MMESSPKVSSPWTKFRLLLWKNMTLQRRQKLRTLVELLLPLVFTSLLVFIRSISSSYHYPDPTLYPPLSVDRLPDKLVDSSDVSSFMKNALQLSASLNVTSLLSEPISERSLPAVSRLSLEQASDNTVSVGYTPSTPLTQAVMALVEQRLGPNISTIAFASEPDMMAWIEGSPLSLFTSGTKKIAGIVFQSDASTDSFGSNISFKIRPHSTSMIVRAFAPPLLWYTSLVFPVFQSLGPRNRYEPDGGHPGYFADGFLALQHATTMAISTVESRARGRPVAAGDRVRTFSQRMPYVAYLDDPFLIVLQGWLPVIIMLSFIYPAINIVKSVVIEKERRLKESMKMMGLSNWIHWLAWYTKSVLMLLVSIAIMTCLLVIDPYASEQNEAVLSHSHFGVVFLYLFLYTNATICFCFMVSTLFSKANSGATAAGVLFFVTYIPYNFLFLQYSHLDLGQKLSASLFFNTAMSFGGMLIAKWEGTGEGVQWRNINAEISPDDSLKLSHIFGMLAVDSVIYLIITWYVESVFPGEFGIPKPWYFPFKLSYWTGRPEEATSSPLHSPDGCDCRPDSDRLAFFEPEPTVARAGVQLKNLRKVYSNGKVAVSGVTLNMYEGNITALLGHNGAGKTTTISVLTGLYPASGGTAHVNGYDIGTSMAQVRASLGICPQHDVLFDQLTVSEHIRFFCTLKGYRGDYQKEIDKMVAILQLEDKRHAQTKTLSGGMKRKLSVGIALCGDSRVVLLDEPTSGMDPAARRSTWELLQKERRGRTIVLTTHFMEEADLLGDRIAIMANGTLQCCGTPLFLKRKYGAGYHLTLVKQEGCEVTKVTDLVREYIPSVSIDQNIGAELSYVLPKENLDKFEALFSALEVAKAELKISGYGASITTMEEVFIRVGEDSDPLVKQELDARSEVNKIGDHAEGMGRENLAFVGDSLDNIDVASDVNSHSNQGQGTMHNHPISIQVSGRMGELPQLISDSNPKVSRHHPTVEREINSGAKLYLYQFWAMIVKKCVYSYRNWLMTLIQFLLPIFFLAMSMLAMRAVPGLQDDPPLQLSLNVIPGTITPIWQPATNNAEPFGAANFTRFLVKSGMETQLRRIDTGAHLSVDEYLLGQQKLDLPGFNRHFMSLIKVESDNSSNNSSSSSSNNNNSSSTSDILTATAMYNNQPFHAAGITMTLLDQALLRMITNDTSYHLTVTNHPAPLSGDSRLELQLNGQSNGFNIAFNTTFGVSFLAASFVLFLVKEVGSKAKHMQFVSGLSFVVYWLANFVWDFVFFVLAALGLLLTLFIFQEEGFIEAETQAALLVVFLMYGYVMLSQTYLLSFCFRVPSTAFTRVTLLNVFSGMAPIVIVAVLRIPTLNLVAVSDTLDWIFMLLPNYAMGMGMSDIYSNYQGLKFCSRFSDPRLCQVLQTANLTNPCCKDTGNCGPSGCVFWSKNYLSTERLGIGRNLLFMFLEGTIGLLLLAIIELNTLEKIKYIYHNIRNTYSYNLLRLNSVETNDVEIDSDVLAEKNRTLNRPAGSTTTDLLILENLTKFYQGDFLAVDRLCLGVPRGECFGLLGVNGAGKTTTFKMLTGDETVSWGDAHVLGSSVRTQMKHVHTHVGYCPQFDAVIDQMTGRETLTMYARLRGIPERKIASVVNTLSSGLYLTEHLDKQVHQYSGGNRRKLSTAVALVGDPPVVFLDEPTTGMDPVARRMLWDVISRIVSRGQSVILTSHSMEECEALCTRLAIMVNGQFKCLGSPQHLKNKFGSGYTLIIKVKITEEDLSDQSRPASGQSVIHGRTSSVRSARIAAAPRASALTQRLQAVREFVHASLPGSALKDVNHGTLHYHIVNDELSWAHIFGVMETGRAALAIEDYSVGQTSLEQVFLNFAKGQR